MLIKTKIVLAAALIFGTVSAASAAKDDPGGGFQVQTWQDIAKSRQDVQNQIHRLYNTNSGDAYGHAASRNRVSHAR